jgi:biopolymer transport protein ExbD
MTIPSTSGKRRARIEVIPLIDIIFFLLATFVMVSLSMVKNQGIAVALPKAATGQPQPQTRSATVTITEAGRVYLDLEPVTFDTLPQRLDALRRQHPELRVVFNGDELAYFGDVVKALDETRKAGIEKVAIQTTGARVAPPAAQ